MSGQDREAWQAQLAADPALRAAWDEFRRTLSRVSDTWTEEDQTDLDALRAAADRVLVEAGEDQARH